MPNGDGRRTRHQLRLIRGQLHRELGLTGRREHHPLATAQDVAGPQRFLLQHDRPRQTRSSDQLAQPHHASALDTELALPRLHRRHGGVIESGPAELQVAELNQGSTQLPHISTLGALGQAAIEGHLARHHPHRHTRNPVQDSARLLRPRRSHPRDHTTKRVHRQRMLWLRDGHVESETPPNRLLRHAHQHRRSRRPGRIRRRRDRGTPGPETQTRRDHHHQPTQQPTRPPASPRTLGQSHVTGSRRGRRWHSVRSDLDAGTNTGPSTRPRVTARKIAMAGTLHAPIRLLTRANCEHVDPTS